MNNLDQMSYQELQQGENHLIETLAAINKMPASDENRIAARGVKAELADYSAARSRRELQIGINGQSNGHIMRSIHGNGHISGDSHLDRELRNYSLVRAIAGAAGLGVDWGLEREL